MMAMRYVRCISHCDFARRDLFDRVFHLPLETFWDLGKEQSFLILLEPRHFRLTRFVLLLRTYASPPKSLGFPCVSDFREPG